MQVAAGVAGAPIVSDTFVMTTSRFNLPYVSELLDLRAERHRLGLWTEVARLGFLTRELRVTVHGAAEGIRQTRAAVGFSDAAPAEGVTPER